MSSRWSFLIYQKEILIRFLFLPPPYTEAPASAQNSQIRWLKDNLLVFYFKSSNLTRLTTKTPCIVVCMYAYIYIYKEKIKWSRYRPGVAQRVGRCNALLFHDRGTRRVWVVSSTPQPHFTPGKDTVPILQEAGWAAGLVCKGGKSRPHKDTIPDRPGHSQSLYRLTYPAYIDLK